MKSSKDSSVIDKTKRSIGDKQKPIIKPGRLIDDPIQLENKISIIGLSENEIEIKIKLEASPDSWNNLFALGFGDPETLGKLLFINFIQPVKEFINRITTRELRRAFMRDSRKYSAAVYVPALYWVKYPAETWPDFFKDLIHKFDHSKITNPKTHILVASRITHQAWEKKFTRRRKKLKLDAKEDRLDFKETFLDGNPYIRPAKDYFDKKNHDLTVKNILKYLKLFP